MSVDSSVTAQQRKVALKVKPWGPDSPFPNPLTGGFQSTYPYNYRDEFDHNIHERQFDALVIENEYLVATVVPELGARIFSLYDKVGQFQVFNLTDVICPSPIYLRGAFIPIGLELNFPCGHNVHAVEPIPCEFVDRADGKGIRMHVFNAVTRMYTEVLVHLAPGERLLRSRITFKNTLPIRSGFMYWSNAAVTQTPEMTFQCKAPMSHFFVNYNTYPYVDGLDLRIAKNRHFASDAFAIGSQEDWFGFYCPERSTGAIHISPVNQMKGKKFFSWGFDDYAFRWGRHYGCDSHGYMEFQAGILETQFEYLHLEPYAKRTVEEKWFPYHETGNVSYANEHFIFSHEPDSLCVTASRKLDDVTFTVNAGQHVSETTVSHIEPGQNLSLQIPKDYDPDNYHIKAQIAGQVLVEYSVTNPAPATPEQIQAKQDRLDIQPTNPENILELAQRRYDARNFSQARKLAEQLRTTSLAQQGERIIDEINYVYDSPQSSKLSHGFNITAIDSSGAQDVVLNRFDYYAALAHADALCTADQSEKAWQFLSDWQSKNECSSPCLAYTMAYLEDITGNDSNALQSILAHARALPLEGANPFTWLEKQALLFALQTDPKDISAQYLLGNYWLVRNESQAERHYVSVLRLDPDNYLALRNLGYLSMRRRDNLAHALGLYEKAFRSKPGCPNLIVEYIIALRLNGKLDTALAVLESLPAQVRTDYRVIKIHAEILRDNRKFAQAIELLTHAENIYVWEGETNHHRCFVECCLALGEQALAKADFVTAQQWFSSIISPPESLVRGRPKIENLSVIYYNLALVAHAQNEDAKARKLLEKAVDQPLPSLHHWVSYRENEYYTALAARELGEQEVFDQVVQRLIAMYAGDNYSAAGTDCSVTGCSYANHLAAARGFMLIGQWDKAEQSIVNGEKTHGLCYALSQARETLAALKAKFAQ
ncbi:MAG: DUF5107 domain-containing protein [Sedimentisphaerales bacterium]|nr:DUF5107 domain-containing protein [Sedimentisphaerales bacterium]